MLLLNMIDNLFHHAYYECWIKLTSKSTSCVDYSFTGRHRSYSWVWSWNELLSPLPTWDLPRDLAKYPQYNSKISIIVSGKLSLYPAIHQHRFPCYSINISHLSRMQNVLDNDFQSLFQMGFDSNSAIDNLGPNGNLQKFVWDQCRVLFCILLILRYYHVQQGTWNRRISAWKR